MIILVETRLSDAMISGHYNMTGWLGWPETTFGDGDTRPMSANVTEVRIEVSLVLDMELDACLDTLEDVDILSSQLSFDVVTFSLDQELLMSGIVDTALQVTFSKLTGPNCQAQVQVQVPGQVQVRSQVRSKKVQGLRTQDLDLG